MEVDVRIRRLPARLFLAVVLMLAAGCDRTPGPTITAEQARQRAGQLIEETLAVVATEMRFAEEELPDFESESASSCTRPMEGSGFTGQVQVYVRYRADRAWPAGTPTPTVAQRFLDQTAAFWQDRQWEVSTPEDRAEVTAGMDDDFLLRAWYDDGLGLQDPGVYLSALSPCIWPSGTPEPD
jgi:hypothetical protein